MPPLVGLTVKEVSEQIAAGVTLVITGFGFTVTTTLKEAPAQPFAVGVTV